MKSFKKYLLSLVTLVALLVLAACGNGQSDGGSNNADSSAEENTSEETDSEESQDTATTDGPIQIGIVGEGPSNEQWNHIQEVAAEEGIEIELVVFEDYATPNTSLSAGDLDLNAYQHRLFLEEYNADADDNLVEIGATTFNPLGLYSETITDVEEIEDGASVAIPNDPSNGGRALILLQQAGLIEVDEAAGLLPTVDDITDNTRNLEIIEIDAAQTPRAQADQDFVVINNDHATASGLIPTEDAFYLEQIDEDTDPYVNIIAARAEDQDNEVYQRIVELYHTDEVKDIVEEATKGSSIPAW